MRREAVETAVSRIRGASDDAAQRGDSQGRADQSLEEMAAMLDPHGQRVKAPPRAGTSPAQGHQRPSAGSVRAASAIAAVARYRPVISTIGMGCARCWPTTSLVQSTYTLRTGAANVGMSSALFRAARQCGCSPVLDGREVDRDL